MTFVSPGSVDVIIVGYGVAGAAAAISAHDAGKRVVILEAGHSGGGNAHYSGGFLSDLPVDLATEHLNALCFGRTPIAVLQAYGEGLHRIESWLSSVGARTKPFHPPAGRFPAPFPSWPHQEAGRLTRYFIVEDETAKPGPALWATLERAVKDRKIEVRFDRRVDGLLTDANNAVTGVRIGETTLEAASVILACGGFEADPCLTDAYLPLGDVRPVGHPLNRGDGVRMAQQAGAGLWHMYGFFGWFAFLAPGFSSPFALDFFAPSHIYLDGDGRRFSDETGYEVHDRLRALSTYLPRNANRPRLPGWAVFDDVARRAGPLNGLLGTPNRYRWSTDNTAEVAAGWVLSADNPRELAAKMGVDANILCETLDRYNSFCAKGRDKDFGRDADTLAPIDLNNLYAIETRPGIAGTTGGPRHDERARVLRPDGTILPGLYAAGAVSMVWGHLIDHGAGLTNALVFGRIAGEQAAAQT